MKFPHLFLIGEAGSGKSNTLERIILPIFSKAKVTAATQVTGFTLLKESASSNMIPQPLDEFKPSKIDRNRLYALYNHMRDVYDGHEGVRGRADQTSVSYQLLAPLIVAGEESADEAAIRERTIELLFSKRDLRPDTHRAAFRKLCVMEDSLSNFGRGLLDVAMRTKVEEVSAWFGAAHTLLGEELPSRIVNNLACCVAGLRLIEKLCAVHELKFEQVFSQDVSMCVNNLRYSVREYLLDGGTSNKSVVEQTLEIMDRMGLDEQTEVKVQGDEIAFRFKKIYDRYTKYRRDYAILGECLTYTQFMKQLRNSDLYIQDRTTRFPGGVAMASVLNLTLLMERCDMDNHRGDVEPLNRKRSP